MSLPVMWESDSDSRLFKLDSDSDSDLKKANPDSDSRKKGWIRIMAQNI